MLGLLVVGSVLCFRRQGHFPGADHIHQDRTDIEHHPHMSSHSHPRRGGKEHNSSSRLSTPNTPSLGIQRRFTCG